MIRLQALACITLALLGAYGAAKEYEITSSSMQSTGVETKFSGNVRISSADLYLAADQLTYNDDTQLYTVAGTPALLKFYTATITTTVSAPHIDFSTRTHKARISGGGYLTHGDVTVFADNLIYDAKSTKIEARDSVKFLNSELSATGNIAQVQFLTNNLAVALEGSPATFTVINKNNKLDALAKDIKYNKQQSVVHLNGGAIASSGNEKISADSISYNLRLGTFIATPPSGGRVTAVISLP